MTRKALLIRHKKNYLDVELEKSFEYGLNKIGMESEKVDIDDLANIIDEFPIEEYDVIAMDVLINSLWASGKRRAHLFESIFKRAKDGAITMYVCDLIFPMQPFLWDKGQHHSEKRNVFNSRPIKVIASYDKSILKDKEAMDKINSRWMSHFHEDSTIHFIEWVIFNYYTYNTDYNPKPVNNLFAIPAESSRNFYYGIKRSYIAKSLEEMGLNSEVDLVYGSIAKSIKNEKVKKIDIPIKEPFTWVKYVENAQNVFFPYEPIKSDYQITSRLLEALRFYKDKIVFDDRVNPRLHKYAQSESAWVNKLGKVTDELRGLY